MKKLRTKDKKLYYKVGKPFVEWLDSHILCFNNHDSNCSRERLENKIKQDCYEFIRSVVKP